MGADEVSPSLEEANLGNPRWRVVQVNESAFIVQERGRFLWLKKWWSVLDYSDSPLLFESAELAKLWIAETIDWRKRNCYGNGLQRKVVHVE